MKKSAPAAAPATPSPAQTGADALAWVVSVSSGGAPQVIAQLHARRRSRQRRRLAALAGAVSLVALTFIHW
ncbi:MAG: hypothetical protein ACREF9_16900, partial [Opitutaceae bacterium]